MGASTMKQEGRSDALRNVCLEISNNPIADKLRIGSTVCLLVKPIGYASDRSHTL